MQVNREQTKKRKLHWPRIIIISVVLIAICIVGIFIYVTRFSRFDSSTPILERIDSKIIKNEIQSSYDEQYEVSDYTIYGETLYLYKENYETLEDNPLQGLNIVLRNVQTEEEYNFVLSDGAEFGVRLGNLKQGLYEMYIYDNFLKKRIYFDHDIESDPFYTLRREDTCKSIQLIARKDYLESFHKDLKKRYAFLAVKDTVPQEDIYDIILDPSGNIYNVQENTIEKGVGNDLIQEADESWQLAQMVQQELENKGLKVAISYDGKNAKSYYGKNSRVGVGYEHKAKAFISLGMIVDEDVNRPIMMVSPYTYGLLANEIAYQMDQSGLELYNYPFSKLVHNGIQYDTYRLAEDGYASIYEIYPQLRESGGKVTHAGGAETSAANKAYLNSPGMESLYFQYANLANPDSISYYFEHKEMLAQVIAKGIIEYYGI